MKRNLLHLLFAGLLLGLTLPTLPAQTSSNPAEGLLAEIKATPFEERDALREKLRVAYQSFTEKLNEWEARKNALPENERMSADAAFRRLERQRAIVRQKISDLDFAAAETWPYARHNLEVSMQELIKSYNWLRARFEPAPSERVVP